MVRLWMSNLPAYCRDALTIRTKAGELTRFRLNRAQEHLHRLLEQQKAEKGWVRAIVLKGRQQGVSTYVQARFYWKTSLNPGLRAYILTHRTDATANLYAIAERFLNHAPIRPSTGASNAKEMLFDRLDSGYQVATAGSEGTGRSATAQLFHGSEVGFWPFADDHLSGIGQIIARIPGTEIILESTGNGIANVFHRLWQAAERGDSDYMPVFIPWFWDEGYQADPPPGFTLSDEEEAYRAAHTLTLRQMAWRRAKIESDFGGEVSRFGQEYPATPSEAFVAVDHESWIPPALVLAAETREIEPVGGRIIVGVDPARFGKNATTICRRRGRLCLPLERMRKADTMSVAGRIAKLIREEHPLRVFIDVGGLGAGVVDRLCELGYGDVVTAINFGETANQPVKYRNRRAEMWGEMKEWLKLGKLPRDDVLAGDLPGPGYKWTSDGQLQLESKDEMRKRGVESPDSGDSLALTFAMPIAAVAAGDPGSRAFEEMLEAFAEASEARGVEGIHTG